MKGNDVLQAGEPASAVLQRQPNPPHRILLVDDDFYIRELHAGVLTRFGYKVDTAEDGAVAWKALKNDTYDLLITDNTMPTVTGLELIKQLRSEDMTLPVILASGTALTEELNRHPWLKLNATLLKPFTLDELLDTVKKVLCQADDSAADFKMFEHRAVKDDKILQAATLVGATRQFPANPSHRILVVDDDSDTRQLSVDVLAGSGYDVESAKDGAAGWDALQAKGYDLVITDNKMPRMTGLEMIEKLRSACIISPVIMATRYLPVHEFARKPWLKPDAMLQRPFSNDDLLAMVQKVLHPGDGGDGRHETLLPMYL